MSTPPPPSTQSFRRRLGPAFGLFFLAPLVGEFLLGNLPITWWWTLLTLAPLYGGGALLIREFGRRAGFGWPSLVLLGLAYAIVEEAFVTQSLFNPDYVGLRLLDYGYVPALGIGAWWTAYVLGLHMIWSTAVPIALVEAAAGPERRTPWLRPLGLAVVLVVFALGCVATAHFQPAATVRASGAQLGGSALVIVALVVLAFVLNRRRSPVPLTVQAPERPAPSPGWVGAAALAGGSLFMSLAIVHAAIPAAVNVSAMLVAVTALAGLILRWSRRRGWTELHRLAAAGGLLLTYAWYGFVQVPSVGAPSPLVDLAGNVVFSAGASVLLLVLYLKLGALRKPGGR